jgi:sugar-specific transcriptional regulator TrmB
VLDFLRKVGFSAYEARAYFTLLVCGEMKAGGIAKMSGVPQSKVYATMESLADKEIVRVSDGTPKVYQTSTPLRKIVKSYVASRQNEIENVIRNGRWLDEVAGKIRPVVRNHKNPIKIFEPKYGRG